MLGRDPSGTRSNIVFEQYRLRVGRCFEKNYTIHSLQSRASFSYTTFAVN